MHKWLTGLMLLGFTTALAEPPARAGRRAAKAPEGEAVKATPQPTGPTLRRSNRVEFDARLVRGEKATGAVYLFQRAPRRLPALVKLERDYLDRIVRPTLGRAVDAKAVVPEGK